MNFPTSVEAFAAFQEEHIGRKLTAFERELCEPLVELINTSGKKAAAWTICLRTLRNST